MFEKDAEEYYNGQYDAWLEGEDSYALEEEIEQAFKDGAEFGYNKANEWQTGEPIKGREIFARNIANCNLLATYFDGAWRNVWNGRIIDFDKIIMWRYTGFKNNGEEIVLPKKIEELEKENAELKSGCGMCYRKDKEQLTKAKGLLTKWVELFKPKVGNIPPTPIQVDTEQFLKEIEK